MRKFDLREELRETAHRRKQPQSGDGSQSQLQKSKEGVSDIAARLAKMFPNLPQDTVHGALSELFRANPSFSREQLADRAVEALVQMCSADPSTPTAITSFEPRTSFSEDQDKAEIESIKSSEVSAEGMDVDADPSAAACPEELLPEGAANNGDLEAMLDEGLAGLLSLPEQDIARCVTTMSSILQRIADKPDDSTVKRLRLGNARFHREVGCHAPALDLLRLAGFEDTDAGEDAAIVCVADPNTSEGFLRVRDALTSVADAMKLQPPTTASSSSAASTGPSLVPNGGRMPTASQLGQQVQQAREARRQRIAELTQQRLQDPRGFASAAKNRSSGNRVVVNVQQRPDSRASQDSGAVPSRRSKHFTLSDIEKMRIEEEISNMPNYAEQYRQSNQGTSARSYSELVARSYDPELISRQALDGTNRYRGSKDLAPLRWHEGIAKIAQEHAEQMARGEMPFSHDGFEARTRRFPVAHRSAGENLALNKGTADVADTAVQGWIKSPGHEKNLRGAWNLCGIGTARSSDGTFYLTQLFANAL